MPHPRLYTPENVERAKLIHIAVVIVFALVCGFMAISTACKVNEVRRAEALLHSEMQSARKLSRQAALEKKHEEHYSQPCNGGSETLALQLSCWARERGVHIESFTPEGAPAPSEIKVGKAKLGTWNAYKVRVKGRGEFAQIRSLLENFRNPVMPVRLDSFALTSSDSTGAVDFHMVLTVYEKKKGGAS